MHTTLGQPSLFDEKDAVSPSRPLNCSVAPIFSAHTANNDDVFPHVLALHVPKGSTIADVTFSKGTFWKNVDLSEYTLLASDIKTGTDCRALPYDDESLDAVVLDPPYIEGFFRRKNGLFGNRDDAKSVDFRKRFSTGSQEHTETLERHDAVLDLYFRAANEAKRVLRRNGVLIVKCQDEVCSKGQRFTHVEIINELEEQGFYSKDLFVVVQKYSPPIRNRNGQIHARKNHSYFLVFIKRMSKTKR